MNRNQNVATLNNSNGVKYYRDVKFPIVPKSLSDIYVITTSGDRLDLLAQQYYNDATLWWIISAANDELPQDSLYLPDGTQLRIPVNTNGVVRLYNFINEI
jgi:phage tail protein X